MVTLSWVLWYYLKINDTNQQLSSMSNNKTELLKLCLVTAFYFFLKGSRHLQSLHECTEMCTSASPAKDSFFSRPPSTSSLTGVRGIICSIAENALWQQMCPSVSKNPKTKMYNLKGWWEILSLQGYGARQKQGDLTWRCLPMILKAFSKANTIPIPVWIKIIPDWSSSPGAPDTFQVLSYAGQQIRHMVKQTCAQRQRTDQVIAGDLPHHLIFKKWSWSRSKILETQRKNTLSMSLWCQFCE